MNHPPTLALWLDLVLVLAIGVAAIVGSAALLARLTRSAIWQRTIWQTSTLGLAVLLAGELSGAARGIVEWSKFWLGAWPDARPVRENQRSADGTRSVPATFSGRAVIGAGGPRTELPQPIVPAVPAAWPGNATIDESLVLADRDSGDRPACESPFASSSHPFTRSVAWWPGLIWAVGAALVAGRLLCAWLLLVAFRRRNRPIRGGALGERIRSIARSLGLRGEVRAIVAPGLAGPIAFGTFRPTIGLPARFLEEVEPQRQDAMLAHELAHLAARDPAWHLFSDVVTAVLWWHPLAWWSRRELRTASEWVADEASLVVRGGPAALAACLVELGTQLVRPRPAAWVRIEGNGFRSSLGRRVQRLLEMAGRSWQPPRRATSCLAKTIGPAAMVAAALACTAWSRPTELPKGESMLQTIANSWRHSLAAVTLLGVLGSSDAPALAALPDDSTAAAVADQKASGDKKPAKSDKDAGDTDKKEKLKLLAREIEELRAVGKLDEAEKLERELRDLKSQLEKSRDAKGVKKPDSPDGKGKKGMLKKDEASLDELHARLKQLEAENAELRAALGGKKGKELQIKEHKLDVKKFPEKPHEGDGKKLGTEPAELREKLKVLEDELAKHRKAGNEEAVKKAEGIVATLKEELEKRHDGKDKKPHVDGVVITGPPRRQGSRSQVGSDQRHSMPLPAPDELGQVLKDLRAEVSRLRDEVAELRQIVKGRGEKQK